MIGEQLYFEDVEEGSELPSFSFGPITTEDLVRWACARGNYHPIHYDKDFSRKEGNPDVLVHGPLKLGLMDRMIREWIGEHGELKKIGCTYRAVDVPGNVLICKGKVISKRVEEGKGEIDCELSVENQKEEVTTKGTAKVILPFRAKNT